jgi:peptidoglycan/xylan/chitin deacetylase (PgdA/CDA1 family)
VRDFAVWPRRLAKSLVATAIGPFLQSETPLILGYHRVVDAFEDHARTTLPGTLISRMMLRRHLESVGRRRQFVTLDEVREHIENGEPFTRPVAAVTFDDGYRDVYENAFPILQNLGVPAAVFVVSSVVGTDKALTHDRLHRALSLAMRRWQQPFQALKRVLADAGHTAPVDGLVPVTVKTMTRSLLRSLPQARLLKVIELLEAGSGSDAGADHAALPMTWEMLIEMRRAGVIIGSHTRSHVLLPLESPAVVRQEVLESRRELEQRLGGTVDHFAYPDGAFNDDAVDAVQSAGYRCGYTACGHRDTTRPWLTIPRRVLWEQSAVNTGGRFSPPILRCQTDGFLMTGADCSGSSHA